MTSIKEPEFATYTARWPKNSYFAKALTAHRESGGFSGTMGPVSKKKFEALEALRGEDEVDESAFVHGRDLFAAVEKAVSQLQSREYANALQELVMAAYQVRKYASTPQAIEMAATSDLRKAET